MNGLGQLGHMAMMYAIPIVFYGILITMAVLLARYTFGIKRFLAIFEENLELNRQRVNHEEKTVKLLTEIRDRMEHRTIKN